MKTRDVVIFTGDRFLVPQCIQRIDHLSTHGWQLRYGGTKLFSDHSQDGSGARRALALATKELLKRIATMPAPSRLRRTPVAGGHGRGDAGADAVVAQLRVQPRGCATARDGVVRARVEPPAARPPLALSRTPQPGV